MTVSSKLNAVSRAQSRGRPLGPGGLAYSAARVIATKPKPSPPPPPPLPPPPPPPRNLYEVSPAAAAADGKDEASAGDGGRRAPSPLLFGVGRWRLRHAAVTDAPAPAPVAPTATQLLNFFVTSAGREWFQLAGHPGSLAPAGPGTVWKRVPAAAAGRHERAAYEALAACPHMRAAVPRYLGERACGAERYLELQDLLHGFRDPHVMDVKLGTRTFLEEEAGNARARADLYDKMVALDPSAPTPAERAARAVTKLRYMQLRERHSSSAERGFRIEAIKLPGAPPDGDLRRVRSAEQVRAALTRFLGPRERTRALLAARLRRIRDLCERSDFCRTHELVGSSVLLVHDERRVGAWLIDFAKSRQLPAGAAVTHRAPWRPGNHEEGLLLGLDSLIGAVEEATLPPGSGEDDGR